MLLKWYIGLFNFSLSFFAILLNLLIFPPVFRLAFVSRNSTIYIIAFFNILSDLCQLSVTCFHLSASIMADRYILSNDRLDVMSILLGGFFANAWFMECLVQIVMAVNRYAIITLNNKTFFTFPSTMIIFVLLLSTSIISAVCVQYLFPCCRYIADHQVMSYMFVNVDGMYSYSNTLLVTYNVTCTSISTLCYMSVFYTIRKTNKLAPANVSGNRSTKEIKYLIQFVFISIFYIFTWVLFELLPHIVPANQPEWYAIVPVLVTCNCSSNSIIFLSTNPEVQNGIPILCIRKKLVKEPSYVVSSVNPPTIPIN